MALVATFAARAGELRLRPRPHADLRAPRGVPAGGGVHRRRPQGDVRLRGQGRSPHRAAARGHRAGRARLRAAPPAGAVEGLVRRAALPLRAPAEGPLPPALAGRRRGARRRRPRGRRRGDRARARLLPRASASTHVDARASTRWATSTAAPPTWRCCASTCSTTPRSSATTFRERVEANPLRVLDSKVDDWQDVIERAPQLTAHLSDESREHVRDRAAPARRARHPLRARARGSCAASTTTPAPRSSSRATALDAAQNAIGGGGRYGKLAEEMGGTPTSGIGFGIGVERVLIACEAEGVSAPPARTCRRVRGERLPR